jgi:CRP-like cAMP-binding protein
LTLLVYAGREVINSKIHSPAFNHWLLTYLMIIARTTPPTQPSFPVETLVTVYESGQFTGEVGTLSGHRSLFRIRATMPGKVIELDREQMLSLVQTDCDCNGSISKILRAGLAT